MGTNDASVVAAAAWYLPPPHPPGDMPHLLHIRVAATILNSSLERLMNSSHEEYDYCPVE